MLGDSGISWLMATPLCLHGVIAQTQTLSLSLPGFTYPLSQACPWGRPAGAWASSAAVLGQGARPGGGPGEPQLGKPSAPLHQWHRTQGDLKQGPKGQAKDGVVSTRQGQKREVEGGE